MQRFILRLLALSSVCAGIVFGQQGNFAQIAYGGSWQTTFTLLNLSSKDPATVTLSFFGDDGSALIVPVQGSGNTSFYTKTIPPGGSQNVVLASSDSVTTQGWATMSVASGLVRGQGSFRFLLPGGQISEAVIPLNIPTSALCLISFPDSNSLILLPFDNTTGQYVTALALANTTNGPLDVPLEFDDPSNIPLVADTLHLTAMQHESFLSPQNYPALAGQKGILRIHLSADKVAVLGLLANATNAITTIIPVVQ